MQKEERLVVISNRLPVSVEERKGRLTFHPSPGGLAASLSLIYKKRNSLWIGWPGGAIDKKGEKWVKKKLLKSNCWPVFLSHQEIEDYYRGFSNRIIWPLFHYFTQYAKYEESDWKAYVRVNRLFCKEIMKIAKPNDIFWIHDYHLMLLPKMLREKLPKAKIGFFLHIPWPSSEVFRLLPWRKELLEGLLGADLISFHTKDYSNHFLSSVKRLLGRKFIRRGLKVIALPIGIDLDQFTEAVKDPKVQKFINRFKRKLGKRKVILSIDRLDYTKGIIERLEAFGLFLRQHPEWRQKVNLILLAVPSRTKVEHYKLLKRRVDELIGQINGSYGTVGWIPIWYLYTSFPFTKLVALYSIGDVALVTPLKDGMNLISKEYIATRTDETGALILSEFAGSSKELREALIVNPNSKEEIVQAIHEALTMPASEQKRRNKKMRNRLRQWDIKKWSDTFLNLLKTK